MPFIAQGSALDPVPGHGLVSRVCLLFAAQQIPLTAAFPGTRVTSSSLSRPTTTGAGYVPADDGLRSFELVVLTFRARSPRATECT